MDKVDKRITTSEYSGVAFDMDKGNVQSKRFPGVQFQQKFCVGRIEIRAIYESVALIVLALQAGNISLFLTFWFC